MSSDPWAPTEHHNNTLSPAGDASITFSLPDGRQSIWTVDDLRKLPHTVLPAYYFSTDHGRHGPYRLEGVALRAAIAAAWPEGWVELLVEGADGYGNRVRRGEVEDSAESAPILLCFASNGQPLTRAQGLVRLVVPGETDNALRQIKWVRRLLLR